MCLPNAHFKARFPWGWGVGVGEERDLLVSVHSHGKNLLAMKETRVGYLGREDPLEKGMATHSSILAWRIPWTEEPGAYSQV